MLFRSQKTTAGQAPEYLVVGLGNPGSQYECTRHNAGFIAMDTMAEKLGFDIKRLKFKGLIGDTVIDGHRVAFLKPSTYMNLSGESVRDAMQFYKIPVEKLLVICDDISLAPGRLRIRRKGSAGGHNGLKNIICLLGWVWGRSPIPTMTWQTGCWAASPRNRARHWNRPVNTVMTLSGCLWPDGWTRP